MNLALFFYLQQWSLIAFLGVLCLIALSNLIGMRRLGRAISSKAVPFVSVMVPARNEAHNIRACVQSLLNQDYPAFEVLVLDDESDDDTGMILASLAHGDSRLRLLVGQSLPSGWLGKNWACHQLSEAARGEYLLFTDADTSHHPRMLHDTVALAEATRADFLSGIPAQRTLTWVERLSVPMIPWIFHTFVPVPLVRLWPLTIMANAIGQFILYRRTTYQQTGGHAAVRASVIEDFDLPHQVKRHRLRWDLVDAAARVNTRMYASLRDVWDGYSKNLFAAFGYNLPVFIFIWLWMMFLAWQPLIWILLNLFGHPIPGTSPFLAAATYLVQVLLWALSDYRFGIPVLQALFYPFTILFFVAIAARSAYLYISCQPMIWKGRDVAPRSRKT